MKKYIKLGILVLISLLVIGCTKPTGSAVSEVKTQADLKQATLEIEGMTCQSCALGVEYELKQVAGVADVKVDYQTGKAVVEYDPAQVDAVAIAQASTAYPAKVIGDVKLEE